MPKSEQSRLLAWRLKLVMREAGAALRNVAQTCRHFALSRKSYYKWKPDMKLMEMPDCAISHALRTILAGDFAGG